MRAFEDFTVGETIDHGRRTVTADEIVAFAREYDPQPFHLDAETPGGLIASGWHITGLFMRLMVDTMLRESTCMGSPGIDALKWAKPLRPGDTIAGRSTVLQSRPSKSRPEMGLVRFRHEVLGTDSGVIMWMESAIMFGRRT